MIWRFVIFFVMTLGVIFGAHYLFYLSLVQIFEVAARNKRLIFWSFVFVSASFILSSLLSHYIDNLWTKIYYVAVFAWMSFFAYFFFSSIVLLILKLIWPNASLQLIASLMFTAGIIFSAYGINEAFSIHVRQETLSLANLPVAWQGRKMVQISDVHLGQIHGVGKVDRIVRELEVIKPDVIFITGDLFDGMDGHLELFESALRQIKAPLGVYFVSGNHEYYLGLDKMRDILARTNIVWLDHKMVEIDGVQIVGENFVFDSKGFALNKSLRSIAGFDGEKTNILLYHIPERLAEAANAGVDLMLSGHTHVGQIFPFGLLTKLIFKGYDFGLQRYGSMYVNTSSGAGTWGPPMRTSGRSEIVEIVFK